METETTEEKLYRLLKRIPYNEMREIDNKTQIEFYTNNPGNIGLADILKKYGWTAQEYLSEKCNRLNRR